MLKTFMPEGDIRELILEKKSREPLHSSKHRKPIELSENYDLNPDMSTSGISEIWLFDDVLTQGTHFRAMHDFLVRKMPGSKVVGFFVARSVYPPD